MAIASYLDTKGLVLIPYRYLVPQQYDGYQAVSGGTSYYAYDSITGNYWKSNAAGDYVVFGFKGTICGVLFYTKTGNCDLIVDGNTIVDNLDVSTIKGGQKNIPYVFVDNLDNGFHEVKILANNDQVRIVGILVDKRLNFQKFPIFPYRNRLNTTLWNNYAAAAGATTGSLFLPLIEKLGIYINVSAATDIHLQIYTANDWQTMKTYSFSGAGIQTDIFPCYPFDYIRFQTSAAATITIQVWGK